MKVLSLKEPWASLVKEGIKQVETRSWPTKYRGELYIQASKRMLTKKHLIEYKEQLDLLKDKNFKYGYIILKCNLVDCIYMNEEYVKNMKKNHNEYISGDYSIGRYAWILKDVEILKNPVEVKGQLGIWTYKD